MAVFKARARALDMLGRQQIAGIPTAISELFKNAHDAYADNVVVDFYRSDRLFVLRDDGIGMTREDFEGRWLSLGTESKLGAGQGLLPPPVAKGKPIRPILGEKGIGRLAIAAIGRQVLILTRAIRDGIHQELVCAFIHWGLFECPGVDLDEVIVPIITKNDGLLPTGQEVSQLVDAVRQNILRLSARLDSANAEAILKDLSQFDVDPAKIQSYLAGPHLDRDGHGTHFIILPADESLTVEIESNEDSDDSAPTLLKFLIGFTNTMTPGHEPPKINTSFRYHRREEFYDDLIAQNEFFTPEEFGDADHHFSGDFDEYGQFRGTISVYGDEKKDYIIPWSGARGLPTDCGPFKLNLAYLPGRAAYSTLPSAKWGPLLRKLNRMGGLYIYRDGIRVLPYGDSDVDFLEFEKRRSKQASQYFFSYRRMFGVIELTKQNNNNLSEKAGREGFRQNKAYREFRSILIDFFIRVAADFFNEGGLYSETHLEKSAEFKRIDDARKKLEKLATSQRQKIQSELEQFFFQTGSGKPQSDTTKLISDLRDRLASVSDINDPQVAATEFLQVEAWAMKELSTQRATYQISKPRGLGLTKSLRRDWEAYQIDRRKLEETVFAPTARELFTITAEAARNANIVLDRRLRLERIVTERGNMARITVRKDAIDTNRVGQEAYTKIREVIAITRTKIDEVVREVSADVNRLDVSLMDDTEVALECQRLEEQIVDTLNQNRRVLEHIKSQFAELIQFDISSSTSESGDDIQAATEEEILGLRDQLNQNLELYQLGMAVNVVEHEFRAVVHDLRNNLRSLRPYASTNRNLGNLYTNLTSTFESLDAYLRLFTPLQRRLYRRSIQFHGNDIASFITRLFSERFRRHKIEFFVTPNFLQQTIIGYPSTFYPIFVNLIDNAIYWSRYPNLEIPWIRLDADGSNLLVTDSGPGILSREREAVFEYGFTRKPGGRGIGLYVSRQALDNDGYSLTIRDGPTGRGTMFVIAPKSDDENTDTSKIERNDDEE